MPRIILKPSQPVKTIRRVIPQINSVVKNNDFIEFNEYLKGSVRHRLRKQPPKGYFSLDYYGWGKPNNPDFINTLKNDFNCNSSADSASSCKQLRKVIDSAIANLITRENITTICVVPRSKVRDFYSREQLLFLSCIKESVEEAQYYGVEIEDGTDYILRHTNTKTTHFHNKPEYSGDGDYPYVGITNATCHISPNVRDKRILLIDDIYTKTINIDEDCMQALFANGAREVVLYTVARTVYKGA